jgi:hypothetical protein
MKKGQREFTTSPLPPKTIIDGMNKTSRIVRYQVSEDKVSIMLKSF